MACSDFHQPLNFSVDYGYILLYEVAPELQDDPGAEQGFGGGAANEEHEEQEGKSILEPDFEKRFAMAAHNAREYSKNPTRVREDRSKKKLQNLKSVSDCYLCFEKLSTQAWACTIKIQFTSDCPHGSIFLIIVFFNALGTQLFLIIGSVHTLLVIIFMYWIKSV